MSIRVDVTDEQTGDTDTCHLNDSPSAGNYILLCGPGTAESHRQVYANGTVVITLKASR